MAVPTPRIHFGLLPFSWLYGLGVKGRNLCFSWGIFQEHTFTLPILCVGNLTLGGTGKTPHTEYLIRLLQPYKTAVLSRGYRRSSHGYRLADAQASAREIGDEPFQLFHKFPAVTVAVDENRVEGIRKLMQDSPAEIILLDDAFQHRYVKAGLNILLTDYSRLITRDALLPAGRLREPASGKHRADAVIVTKCPANLSWQEQEEIRKELNLNARQRLFFSHIVYGQPVPVTQAPALTWEMLKERPVLLLAGIANPVPFLKHVQQYAPKTQLLEYRDHHAYTPADLQKIRQHREALGESAIVLTTEKDASRLKSMSLPDALASRLYQVAIEVEFSGNQQADFQTYIFNFVEKQLSVCKEQK